MSSQPKVSDDEMRYFQFKARQMFLLRKEDHDWNEFCKRNTCTCCSCQPTTQPKATKETAVQATPIKRPASYGKAVSSTVIGEQRTMPKVLNEIKTRLEKIDLALSAGELPTKVQTVNQGIPQANIPSNITKLSQNPMYEKRVQLIQDSLKQSIQRLQSSAQWKATRPASIKKKNSGYFLPHELEKQRKIARNAYLASLSKPSTLVKEKQLNKQTNIPQKLQKPKGVLKTRKENHLKLKNQENQKETLIIINPVSEDKKPSSTVEQSTSSASAKPFSEEGSLSSRNWAKIRQNFLNLRKPLEFRTQNTDNSAEIQDKPKYQTKTTNEIPSRANQSSASTVPKTLSWSDLPPKKELLIENHTAQDILKHRTDYLKYLERVSRTRKGQFDPRTLANMISEFLLDECIEEVAKELQDVPGFMVTDLYDQEFLQTL